MEFMSKLKMQIAVAMLASQTLGGEQLGFASAPVGPFNTYSYSPSLRKKKTTAAMVKRTAKKKRAQNLARISRRG